MNIWIERAITVFFIAFFPLFFLGIINRVKARWAGRKGPSVFQPFYDFSRFMKKGEVISTTTSFVFRMAPSVSLGALICAALIVPVGEFQPLLSFKGDFILFAYLLGLAKFASILNAMDTGSSFEGMGASREATFTALVEPAFFIIIASIAYLSGYTSLKDILMLFTAHGSWAVIITVLAGTALFIMLLVEGCRVPVDDPTTHLELTMIHEVMVLDNSGPDMGFITYAAGLKMYSIAAIIASLAVLPGMGVWTALALFAAVICVIAVCVGLVESFRPRLRMVHVPEFVLIMISIALLICAGVIIYQTGGAR